MGQRLKFRKINQTPTNVLCRAKLQVVSSGSKGASSSQAQGAVNGSSAATTRLQTRSVYTTRMHAAGVACHDHQPQEGSRRPIESWDITRRLPFISIII